MKDREKISLIKQAIDAVGAGELTEHGFLITVGCIIRPTVIRNTAWGETALKRYLEKENAIYKPEQTG